MPLTEKELLNLPNGTKVLFKKSELCSEVKDVIMIKVGFHKLHNGITFKTVKGYCTTCKKECIIKVENLEIRNTFEILMNRNGANK